MQGEFEKKVQAKLEELQLTPSGPLWEKIRQEIAPEKKRRRFPLWIPFILVLLAGGGWWWQTHREEAKENFIAFIPGQSSSMPASSTIESKNLEQPKPVFPSTEAQLNKTRKSRLGLTFTDSVASVSLPVTPRNNRPAPNVDNNRNNNINGNREEAKNVATKRVDNKRVSVAMPTNEKQIKLNITAPFRGENGNSEVSFERKDSSWLSGDTAVSNKASEIKVEKGKIDTVSAKQKIALVQPKWRKTVTLEGGRSKPSAGDFYTTNRVADNSSGPVTGSYSGVTSSKPATLTGGVSFRIGAGVTRALRGRWEISAGVQYAYFSTKTEVGKFQPVDTIVSLSNRTYSVDGYYRNNGQQVYRNRYHVLEIPVSVGYRPLPQIPLSITVGASYGRLLQSNALVYNRTANIFYTDKEIITKDLFTGFSSLQYTLLKRTALQWKAGPVVRYQFSKLQKENGAKQHLFFAGLQTTFIF